MSSILITTQKVDTGDPVLHFFLDWIREFATHYDKVYVICLQAGDYDLPDNVVVRSLGKEINPSRFRYTLMFYKHVLPLIVFKKVDKIFFHMNEIYILLMMPFLPFRFLYGIPSIWWKTQAKLGPFSKLMRFFVTKIFTASADGFKVSTRKKVITGHGINVDHFKQRSLTPPDRPVQILAVGRVVPIKNYELLIKSAAILKKDSDNFHIDIVGLREEDEGDYVNYLHKLIKESGLIDFVEIKPQVSYSAMPGLYRAYESIVNVTYPYTYDKVSLEAMASGLIPITPTPSYRDLMSNYDLFPTDNSEKELAKVLHSLINLSSIKRLEIGGEMRDHIIKHHGLHKLIKRIADF